MNDERRVNQSMMDSENKKLDMDKEQSETYLIEMMHCFLDGRRPERREDIDWDQVVYLAHINSVLGIVSCMIFQYHLEENEAILGACRSCYNRIANMQRKNAKNADALSTELEKNSIDHVFFKGAEIKDLYPVPEFRSYGDVDVLIRKEQRQVAAKLMKELGFQESKAWEPVFDYKKDQELYEVHSELLETDIPGKLWCREYFQEPWSHVVKLTDHRYSFTPEYHFLYLLTHLAKHLSASGAGIRMYMDLAVFIKKYGDEMDWEEIGKGLSDMDLLDFGKTVLFSVKHWFGTECPLSGESKSDEFMRSFLHCSLHGGVFGREDKDAGFRDLSKAARDPSGAGRIGIFLKRLFPPAKQIAPRYTYLQKRPWLLPAAWIHRFVITRSSISYHRKEMQEIFTSDLEEVKEYNRLLQEAGL